MLRQTVGDTRNGMGRDAAEQNKLSDRRPKRMNNPDTNNGGSLERMVRRIVAGRAYTIMESVMSEYERGGCEFRDEQNEVVVPSIFGRAGDGFHAVFNSPNSDFREPAT